MFRHILVAVDGSETGDRALAQAITLAREHGARLRIMHVGGEVLWVSTEAVTAERIIETVYESARAVLDEAAAKAKAAGIDAETRLIDSRGQRVSHLIAETARAWPADLVVIGSHGRRGLDRLLLGSVAEQFVRIAPCTLMLVRG